MPLILQSLLPPIATVFAVQTITAIPSIAFRTDRFYDVSGSLAYLAAGAVSLFLPALRARAITLSAWRSLFKAAAISCNWRQAALTGLMGVWASRLNSYLFNRKDRYDDTSFRPSEKSPYQMVLAVVTQILEISITLAPVLLINGGPKLALAAAPPVILTDILGLALGVGGIAYEAIAQWQKGRRHEKTYEDKIVPMTSQRSNYLGEISLWTGIATVAAGALAQEPVQIGLGLSGGIAEILATTAVSFISPAFVAMKRLGGTRAPLNEADHNSGYIDLKAGREFQK